MLECDNGVDRDTLDSLLSSMLGEGGDLFKKQISSQLSLLWKEVDRLGWILSPEELYLSNNNAYLVVSGDVHEIQAMDLFLLTKAFRYNFTNLLILRW